MVAENWPLLQPFLECHQSHHKHSSHGMSQRSVTACTPKSSLCHVIFSNFFVFVLGCRPTREVNFFSGDSNVFLLNFIRCHWKVCAEMELHPNFSATLTLSRSCDCLICYCSCPISTTFM
jgi:hypothetical protein